MTVEDQLEVTLATPGDWIVVDQAASVEALVGDHLAAVPELKPHREQLTESVADTMARAGQEGVLFMAVLADPGAQGVPIIATAMLATTLEPPEPLRQAAEPAAGLPDVESALEDPDVTQRDVRSMLLSGGPALRVARLIDVPLVEGGPALTLLSVQYFFTAAELDQVFVLQFTSPSAVAHDELQRLFHEIADSFRVRPAA